MPYSLDDEVFRIVSELCSLILGVGPNQTLTMSCHIRATRAVNDLAWAGTLQCIEGDRSVGMCNKVPVAKYKNKTSAILKRLGLQENFECLHVTIIEEEILSYCGSVWLGVSQLIATTTNGLNI